MKRARDERLVIHRANLLSTSKTQLNADNSKAPFVLKIWYENHTSGTSVSSAISSIVITSSLRVLGLRRNKTGRSNQNPKTSKAEKSFRELWKQRQRCTCMGAAAAKSVDRTSRVDLDTAGIVLYQGAALAATLI